MPSTQSAPASLKASTTRSRLLNESATVTVMMTSFLPRFAIFLFLLSVHHPTKNRDEPNLRSCEEMKFKTSFFAAPLFFCEIIMQFLKKHTSPEYCSKRAFVSPYSISPNITVEKSGNRNFCILQIYCPT
jgi:hypothetical protein